MRQNVPVPLTSTSGHGFFGKLPGRGDFVSAGLPPRTIAALDDWAARMLSDTVSIIGKAAWTQAWLSAPVWKFALQAQLDQTPPLLGLWLPSVDKVGRYFPLMIVASRPDATPEQMARHGTAWLDAAEDAGRAAIADDLTPDQLTARIPPPPDLSTTPDTGLPCNLQPRPGAGLWWTEGAPRVPAHGLVLDTMPDAASFLAMLDATYTAP